MRALNTRIEHTESRSLLSHVGLVGAIAAAPSIGVTASKRTASRWLEGAQPIRSCGSNHFVWLASRQWNTPLVYQIAMADSDATRPAVGGRQSHPVQDGAFR